MSFLRVRAVVALPFFVLLGPVLVICMGGGGDSAVAVTGDCPDATITIEIKTDFYPQDITWELVQQGYGVVVSDGPLSQAYTVHTWDVCVDSTACYDFTIYDSYGDGLEHPEYYRVFYEGELVGSGGPFGDFETVLDIGDGCVAPFCGDGTCDPDESHLSCPEDCPPCEYCQACYTEQESEWITRVVFNTIDNRSGQDGPCSYGDYTAVSTTLMRESTHNLRVSFFSNGQWDEHVRAWIDWNRDCAFESSESYYLGEGVDATLSRSVTVPADALLGCTRMRVVDNYDTDAREPCPDLLYGEVEDYTVCVTDGTVGACCVDADPWCRGFVTEAECDAQGGMFLGIDSTCDVPDCNDNGVSDLCDFVADGDFTADGVVGLEDYEALVECLDGPGASPTVPIPDCLSTYLAAFDADMDGDVDLRDVGAFQIGFAGSDE